MSKTSAPLSHTYAFLDSLIENIPLMIFVKEARDLRFVRFNKAGQDLIGLPSEDLIGKNDFDLFPREQAEYFVAKDRAVLNGREIVDIPEEPIMTVDKGLRVLHTRKIPLLDGLGRPEYLLGISEDITEKKEAEENRMRIVREEIVLKEREAFLRQNILFSQISVALASSLDYRAALAEMTKLLIPEVCDWCSIGVRKENGSFERVVLQHRDPTKQGLLDRLRKVTPLRPDESGGVSRVILQQESHLSSPATEADLRRESSSEEHFQILREIGVRHFLVVPIKARENTLGAIALFRNGDDGFSDRDRFFAEEVGRRAGISLENAFLYEKAQRAIESRDHFFSIASHELKTPLTSLHLLIQVAERSAKGAPLEPSKLDRFKRQLDRLTSLVEDLLDVTRIQAGKISFNFELLNLADFLRDIVERYHEPMTLAGCGSELDVEEGIFVPADAGRLEQALVNILSNAIKYAPGKPVCIGLKNLGDRAEIFVQDAGPGIARERQAQVFERFERADASRNISGLGLGLFITKKIIEGHGGEVLLESEIGRGSRFVIRLPIAPNT